MKTIIITGNSGSGKTFISTRIEMLSKAPLLHLDEVYWKPDGFNEKRSDSEIKASIESFRKNTSWIVEGIIEHMLNPFMNDADTLIWLDIDWRICKKRLIKRHSEKRHNRTETPENFKRLLQWAEEYYTRGTPTSHAVHKKLFEKFSRKKFHVERPEDIDLLLKEI